MSCFKFPMMLAGRLLAVASFVIKQNRSVTLCACLCKDYSSREAKFMKKLLSSKPSKRRSFQEERTKSVTSVIDDPTSRRATPMRVAVLNKLLMSSITDILATGEISSNLVGRGMEITNVSVNKDYQQVKVYWCAKSKEDETFLAKYLVKLSHSLRHELSQLHLMGSVPKILFYLDKTHSRLTFIDNLIQNCDKGDDNEVTDFVENEHEIPKMTHNVYGLQHDVILAKILKSINKAKAPHRNSSLHFNPLSVKTEAESKNQTFDPSSKYNQKDAIRKFLLQKRLDKERVKKNMQNEGHLRDTEVDYYEEMKTLH